MWAVSILKTVLGIYMMITIILLINLLIAMMSDTYTEIEEQSDIEWKFGRAKLFRNMNRTSSAPSPINLVTKLITYVKILAKHRGQRKMEFFFWSNRSTSIQLTLLFGLIIIFFSTLARRSNRRECTDQPLVDSGPFHHNDFIQI